MNSPTPAHASSDAPLPAQLRELRAEVDSLRARVVALENAAGPAAAAAESAVDPAAEPAGVWLRDSGALRRLATISFVLVVALVLRTLTDNGVLDKAVGVWLGVGYAVLLQLVGWRRFAANRAGKRVFMLCGALLLCALVLETQGGRFASLSAAAAHGLLLVALLSSASLGVRYSSPIVVELGVFGAATSAIAIGFPRPEFPATAGTLVLAMVAESRMRWPRRSWLPWALLVELAFFWLLWVTKLQAALGGDEGVDASLYLPWFAPALAVTFAVLAAIASTRGRRQPGAFALVLPAATMALAIGAAAAALVPWLLDERWLGLVALSAAAAFVLMACWRRTGDRATATAFTVAAVIAFVPGVWLAIDDEVLKLPLLGGSAIAVAAASSAFASGALRVLAACLQAGVFATAVARGVLAASPTAPWRAALLAAVLAALAAAHHRWARRVAPPPASLLAGCPGGDPLAHVLFWCAIAATFSGLRVASWPVLAALTSDVPNAFAAGQSVLLAAIAIVMLVTAWWRERRAMLHSGVIVAGLAGVKVFASDLVSLQGVPLVLAVFAFGLTAAVGSFVLGRWPHAGREPASAE